MNQMNFDEVLDEFQSPEGDSLFFYPRWHGRLPVLPSGIGFSPPKGIHCFSTNGANSPTVP